MKLKSKVLLIFIIMILIVMLIPNFTQAHGNYNWITTYYTNQCTWYACGRVKEVLGINIDLHWGHAFEWIYNAPSYGYTVDSTPASNTVAVWPQGAAAPFNYGHVAYVEFVDGDYMRITEYNYNKKEAFEELIVHTRDNRGYGGPPQFIHFKEPEKPAPTVSNLHVHASSIRTDSIRVRAYASDNATKVNFRIWRTGSSSNSGTTKSASPLGNGYWETTFTSSELKVMNDNLACIDVVAYNSDGKASESKHIYDFHFGNTATNLGSFTARIVMKANTNYCLGISGDNNGDKLKLKTKNLSDTSQLWKFEETSTKGFYKITNVKNGRSIDVTDGEAGDKNGTIMQLWTYNPNSPHHKYLVQSYNGGYRLVPTNTAEVRGIDVKDGTIANNNPIILYEVDRKNNNAQTWVFEKVATGLSLGEDSITLELGAEKTLKPTITPSDVATSNLTWSSSNNTVATVSNGKIVAKAVGTTTITVKTTDGSNLSKTCTVTVTKAATGFSINKSKYQINSLSERPKIEATLNNGQKANVTWSSSNTAVATVNSDGIITPKGGGFTYITAKSDRFGSQKCWVYVCSLVTLSDGRQRYPGDVDGNGVFNSNDTAVILDMFNTNTNDDKLIGDLDGNKTVNANDASLMADICKYGDFTVGKYTKITGISISNSLKLKVGGSGYLRANVEPSALSSSANFVWSSSNSSIASVDSTGKVTAKKEGTATISVYPSGYSSLKKTCTVTVTDPLPFNDVPENSWFYEAVKYNYKNNIIKGYEDGTFKPGNNITRGQLVTILWRMENEPKVNTNIPFNDVNGSAYYANAIKWASNKKIVNGYDDGAFRPDTQITRQQLAVILCNYAKYKGKNVTANISINNYKDNGNVAGYATESIKWAIKNGVMSGKDQGTAIDPTGTASRCECAAMIYNYCIKIK